MNTGIGSLGGGLPAVVQAVLLLIIAFIVAGIARNISKKIIRGIFRKRQLEEGNKNVTEMVTTLGNVVYAIVFLLFLPGALDRLGLDNVSKPISAMATTFLNFLPNIIAAVIVMMFGGFLARLVKQLLLVLLKKTRLDALQEKCGIAHKENAGFSDIIANIVYALLVIIFVVAGLQILKISAISDPAMEMVNQIFAVMPRIFVAIVLVAVGAFIARLTASVLETVLAGTGMDEYVRGALPNKNGVSGDVAASRIIAVIVKVVINIFFIVAAINLLHIDVLTKIGTSVIAYMPQLLAAVLVLTAAWLLASWVEKGIIRLAPNAAAFAHTVHIAIIVIAAFMILSQLGIAPYIVNTLFTVLAVGFAAAMAIAFGIGGRDWAKNVLENFSKNIHDQMKQ